MKTFDLFGLSFVKWTMKQTIERLTERVQQRQFTHVITGNPIMVMAGLEDANYMQQLQSADVIVPDGAGIVWASRKLNDPVQERVAGFDLMHELLAVGETLGWKVFLLGTDPLTIRTAEANLKARFPRIQWVGIQDGFFKTDQDPAILARLQSLKPDLLFVARSAALQEPWIAQYREQLGATLVMGVGGSFDVIAGKLKRAPRIWIALRLEWLYRLFQEPWRYKRMLGLPLFMQRIYQEKRNRRKISTNQ
jgi:N-acetylglucosaminyldiphosphoundecaprenol N-acetyl-beta-D-mannosaminyltransferase